MKLQRIFAGVVAGALLIFTISAMAQPINPKEFRDRLTAWAQASEVTVGPARDLVDRIDALSDDQLADWLYLFDDPETFMRSLEQATELLQEHGVQKQFTPLRQDLAPFGFAPQIAGVDLFEPDYPPNSGAYKDTILNGIAGFGITASNTNRCDATEWAAYVGVWWPLNKTFDTLDGACVVAGCDPTGIGCAITCGILEVAKVALKIAAVPLESCDIHQGAIDGAEIEATFENSIRILEHLSVHDEAIKNALSAHDAHIKSALDAHDHEIKDLLGTLQESVNENSAKLELLLARQLEVIRLLVTPQGRRTTEVPACGDAPCDWNPPNSGGSVSTPGPVR